MQALRKIALAFPEVEEGIACKGTAIECATFKVRGKAFLFVGRADVRVKLSASLAEVAKVAAKEPDRYQAGAHGWVKVTFGDDEPLPVDALSRWIEESYRLLAPKQPVPGLTKRGSPKKAQSRSSQQKTGKSKAGPR